MAKVKPTIRYARYGASEFELLEPYHYESPRYKKSVYIPKGRRSDGATGAMNIYSAAWWVHDELCATAMWQDQSPCNALQAATVLRDILIHEGRWFRALYWAGATYWFGCKKPREHGWW